MLSAVLPGPVKWSVAIGIFSSLEPETVLSSGEQYISQLIATDQKLVRSSTYTPRDLPPLPSNRQHLSFDDCLMVSRENNQNFSELYCVRQLCTMIRTQM